MRCSTSSYLATLAFLCVTRAQTTTSTPESSSTIAAGAATHTVKVGIGSNQFDPVSLNASVGDTITFQFLASGHSVVQSYFQQPCIPYDTYSPGHPTFFSGFKTFTGTPDIFPTWNLTINTTDPVYYYCSKTDSCLKEHMIGVINPNSTWTFAAQNASIDTAKIMLQPGQPIPAEGASSSTKHGSGISAGVIAGIAVAVVVVVVGGACAMLWFLRRQKRLKRSRAVRSGSAAEQWGQGAQGPDGSMAGVGRPPSYAFDFPPAAQMAPMDMQKEWEGRQVYGYGYQAPVHELGVADPVELDDDSRGRARTRDGQQQDVYMSLLPKQNPQ